MNEFLNKIKKGCIDGWTQYRVLPSLTAAQAVLESGWGKYAPHNALFGIKADRSWKGRSFSSKTQEEYEAGVLTDIVDRFRAYDSWEDSILDHGKFLNENPRYAKVIGETDYKKACQYIKDAGYATDSTYVDKLIQIIEYNKLYEWDPKEKNMVTVKQMTADLSSKIGGGVNPDGYYGYQCKDVFDYVTLKVGNKIAYGNASDIPAIASQAGCKYIKNTWQKGLNPQEGDLVVYSVASHGYGHVGYVLYADENKLIVLEQNIDGNADFLEVGGPLRKVTRSYSAGGMTVIGWARPNYSPELQSEVSAGPRAGVNFIKNETGTMTVSVDKLNVRDKAGLDGRVVASYSKGERFNYDSVYDADGYRWLSYVSYSGARRYVAYRKIGGEKYGTVA